MIIAFPTSTRLPTGRRLDALAVEAALNGHRPYRRLAPAEAAEVLRILRRRGMTLGQAAELLDVHPEVIATQHDEHRWPA